jgi:hypothetical protein
MRHVFTIIPAGNGPVWFFAGLSVFLLLIVALFAWIAFSSRYARFEVSPDGLRLVGDIWGRTIPSGALVPAEARAVNLRREAGLAPRGRRWGTALPGFAAGWFRLRDGRKGLVYLTDWTRVAYVPTREDYVVLLSVDDPERFVRVLRETVRD